MYKVEQILFFNMTYVSFSQLKLQPKLKADGTPRKQIMSPFAQFVKENYSLIRKQTPDHRQVMSKLATMYKNSTL